MKKGDVHVMDYKVEYKDFEVEDECAEQQPDIFFSIDPIIR